MAVIAHHVTERYDVLRAWTFSKVAALIGVVAIVGVVIFLYPDISNWTNQYYQVQILRNLQEQERHATPPAIEQIDNALRYNQALQSGAIVGANERLPIADGHANGMTDGGLLPYDQQLNIGGTGIMGRIRIPKIDVDLPIYHGTSEETLLKGVGHLEGTSLPVGGESTHSVLTGHRGLASAKIFTDLDRIVSGDSFVVEILGQAFTYRVFDVRVVEPSETQYLKTQPGKDLMTLVTCTPIGINSHRILVTGERVVPTPQRDKDDVGKNIAVPFPMWAVWLGLALVLVGLYQWRMGFVTVPAGRDGESRDGGPREDGARDEGSREGGSQGAGPRKAGPRKAGKGRGRHTR